MAERRDAEEPAARRPEGAGSAAAILLKLAALAALDPRLGRTVPLRAAPAPQYALPEETPDIVRLAELAAGQPVTPLPAMAHAVMTGPAKDVAKALMPRALVRKLEAIPQEVYYQQVPYSPPRYAAATGMPLQHRDAVRWAVLNRDPAELLAAKAMLRDAPRSADELTTLTPTIMRGAPTHEALHTLYRLKTGIPFVPEEYEAPILSHFLNARPNLLPLSRIEQLAGAPGELLLDFLAASSLARQGAPRVRRGTSAMARPALRTLYPSTAAPEFLTPTLEMLTRIGQR